MILFLTITAGIGGILYFVKHQPWKEPLPFQIIQAHREQTDTNPISSHPIEKQRPQTPVRNFEKININLADLAELQNLPGIGVKTAEKIIRYRERQGAFSSLEELLNVPGIGHQRMQQIKSRITL